MHNSLIKFVTAGTALVCSPSLAQQPVPASAAALPLQGQALGSSACEIHLWPAARVSATTSGAGAMFGLIGGLIDAASNANRNKRDKAFITGALDAAAQARALRELNLPSLLNLPAGNVIAHQEGIELTGATTGRLSPSVSPCYYDVVVRQLFYLKTAMTKGKMRTFILVRGANGNSKLIDYKDSANHAVDVKMPEEGEDVTTASSALINAFKADVTEFGQKFVQKTTKS